MANVSLKVVFGILFLILSSADVDFLGREYWWMTYTIEKVLSTTRCIELMGKIKFVAAVLDPESEIFVIHIASFSSIVSPSFSPLKLDIHLFCRPQISSLIAKKTLTKVPNKYDNFVDVFSLDLVSKLFKQTKINDHAIKLVNSQQPPYGLIHSLEPVELETLKAYIKINLANGFIKPSKFSAGTSILFKQKIDNFFQLCINYQSFNNLTIQN